MFQKNSITFFYVFYKKHKKITSFITENKVIEIFCLADDFCKLFDKLTRNIQLNHTSLQ